MTGTLRTVRKLDGLPEQKTVRGIVIEKGLPIPPQNANRLTPGMAACLALEVGESFVYSTRGVLQAKHIKATGREFAAREIAKNRYRIWRTK